jgi:hypothetical protein
MFNTRQTSLAAHLSRSRIMEFQMLVIARGRKWRQRAGGVWREVSGAGHLLARFATAGC